ncbi:hypothetical protein Prudu_005676 [Prunus dulcis]|uniref:Uncharacterized protein n=1 Tax=Prunus dulcis TaxID=3755 RepID=A0A4Y1QY62_PRUDU|nr:hypothetical protein Prudu_005676 [Prunus dulcis]
MGLGNLKADLDYITHWKYGSLKATRQFVKVQRPNFGLKKAAGSKLCIHLALANLTAFFWSKDNFEFSASFRSLGNNGMMLRLRSFGKGYHSASDRVRTLCGFCKLLQRNAVLVTFVARFATCSFSNLQIWNFALLKNTRKVFSEYHNVPMDTHKVFTALVQWGSCRSPSVIHNREQFGTFSSSPSFASLGSFYRPRGTDIVEPIVASHFPPVKIPQKSSQKPSTSGMSYSSLPIEGRSKVELQEIARQIIFQASQMDDENDASPKSQTSTSQPQQSSSKKDLTQKLRNLEN